MHPAFSVIFFTTFSGAGYGLWIWLGILAAGNALPARTPSLIALGLGFVCVTAGLLSSTLHLGQPQRAWRAFSQWRSSWLSREGVASVSLLRADALAWRVDLVRLRRTRRRFRARAAVAGDGRLHGDDLCLAQAHSRLAASAGGARVPGVRRVHRRPVAGDDPRVVGSVAGQHDRIRRLARRRAAVAPETPRVAARSIAANCRYRAPRRWACPQTARARVFERPHTEANYLNKEMGFVVARKHSRKLRIIA